MSLLKDHLFKFIDHLEEQVREHSPRKGLLKAKAVKGLRLREGQIGTDELKKAMSKLIEDGADPALISGIVHASLYLGNNAGKYLYTAQAKDYFKPLVEKEKKRLEINKNKEYFFKEECLFVAERTWNKYPTASIASLAKKLCEYYCNEKNYQVSLNTIEKNWLAKAEFLPTCKSDRKLVYVLTFE